MDAYKEKKTKRIIEKIEGLATYVTIPRELAIYNVNIDSQEAKLLVDYITNLKQENERLNHQLELQRKDNIINKIKKALKDHKEIKNKTNTKEYYIEVDEVLDYIKELESK